MKRYSLSKYGYEYEIEEDDANGELVPYTYAAAIEAERDALREEIATLRAALAAERALRTLRPMSGAPEGEEVFGVSWDDTLCRGARRGTAFVTRWLDYESGSFPLEAFKGYIPLPEPIEPPTPDTDHYHD